MPSRCAIWERICNRCTGFVAVATAPNAKCQRVPVLALCLALVSDIAIFVLKRDVKLQLTNYASLYALFYHWQQTNVIGVDDLWMREGTAGVYESVDDIYLYVAALRALVSCWHHRSCMRWTTARSLVIELAAGTARRSACVDGRVSYTLKQLAVVFAQWPSLSSRLVPVPRWLLLPLPPPALRRSLTALVPAHLCPEYACLSKMPAAVSVVAARWRHGPLRLRCSLPAR